MKVRFALLFLVATVFSLPGPGLGSEAQTTEVAPGALPGDSDPGHFTEL
jgi:hypothetical protein